MQERKRPRVAFFSFTSCEGCQLMVLSCEDELPDIFQQVNIVYFREAMTSKSDDYEIAFIEGSVSTRRENSSISAKTPGSWWPSGPAPPRAG
jgi:coenzyme F420-reducing hydrogenase gamma subunit